MSASVEYAIAALAPLRPTPCRVGPTVLTPMAKLATFAAVAGRVLAIGIRLRSHDPSISWQLLHTPRYSCGIVASAEIVGSVAPPGKTTVWQLVHAPRSS